MNVRPLPPQLTWVCPLVRFVCFHTVSAPRHLLPEHFCPLFPRVPCLSVVKTVVSPLFARIPGGALSVEKRTEFFLLHSKICKWSGLWSTALHCICRQPVSILFMTQTVVKIMARRISFCDAVDKEKGFENSVYRQGFYFNL